MSNPKVEALLPAVCPTVGEGPHWDVPSQSLWFVDIESGQVHKWEAATGTHTKAELGGTVSFAVPRAKGGLVIGHSQSVSILDWDTKDLSVLAEVEQTISSRFNDAKCDASGRLWAGTMGSEAAPGVVPGPIGSLYSVSPSDYKITKHVGEISISNGLDWTDDNSIMYFIDSVPRKVFAFDFDLAEGMLSNQRTVIEFPSDSKPTYGLPDGMCMDTDGKIWVACFSASRVHRFDPETGKTLQTIEFPATNITSCCFGGQNMDELFVTSSQYKLTPEQGNQPLAGSIFRVTGLGVKGRAPNNFEG